MITAFTLVQTFTALYMERGARQRDFDRFDECNMIILGYSAHNDIVILIELRLRFSILYNCQEVHRWGMVPAIT